MRIGSWRLVLLAIFAAAVCAFLTGRQSDLSRLRTRAAQLAGASGELSQLRAENERLRTARASEGELESLRADHATIARLRNEVAAVQRSLDKDTQSNESKPGDAVPQPATLLDHELTKDQWRNAGRKSPAATIETMLWAAASGDVGNVAGTLEMSDETRRKADALYASLPRKIREDYGGVDNLVALLTAKEAPMGAASVVAEVPDPHGTVLVTSFKDFYGHSRLVALSLRTDGNAWRIDVPPSAIDRYAAIILADPKSVEVSPLRVP